MAQKRKRNKKWIYWLMMLVFFVVAVVISYLVWDNYFRDKKMNNDVEVETVNQIDKSETIEQDGEETIDGESSDETTEKKKVEQYDGGDPNEAMELSGAVTFAQVVDDKLMIRVNIDQYLENGECNLVLKRGNNTVYSGTSGIINNASTATCEGFDIQVGEIGYGKTEISIEIESGGKKGLINGEVEI